jgi:hypothetical protein
MQIVPVVVKICMRKDHKHQPSGDKQEGLGIKPVISAENLEGSDEMTKKYTKNETELAQNVRERHPNRNTDQENSTNAGRGRN